MIMYYSTFHKQFRINCPSTHFVIPPIPHAIPSTVRPSAASTLLAEATFPLIY